MLQEENTFLVELEKLHQRRELSLTVGPDYFEPGMMEHLDQYDGIYNPETQGFSLRFEVKGTRYDGRTEQIEKLSPLGPDCRAGRISGEPPKLRC